MANPKNEQNPNRGFMTEEEKQRQGQNRGNVNPGERGSAGQESSRPGQERENVREQAGEPNRSSGIEKENRENARSGTANRDQNRN